jgi:hypothetical protein
MACPSSRTTIDWMSNLLAGLYTRSFPLSALPRCPVSNRDYLQGDFVPRGAGMEGESVCLDGEVGRGEG